MIRTTDHFIADLRSDLADQPDTEAGGEFDTLWSNRDLLRYLNSAAARLASDTLALSRRFIFKVTARQPTYRFPFWQILDVHRATYTTPALGGGYIDIKQFDINDGYWTDDYGVQVQRSLDLTLEGTPRGFSRDFEPDQLRLYPMPHMDGDVEIYATVLPDILFAGMPVPFQAQQDWDLLLMWAKKMAYEKQDADTLDLSRAKAFESEYLRFMPDRRSEIDRIRRNNAILKPRTC